MELTPPGGQSGVIFENADTWGTLFSPSSLDQNNFLGTHHGFMRYVNEVLFLA